MYSFSNGYDPQTEFTIREPAQSTGIYPDTVRYTWGSLHLQGLVSWDDSGKVMLNSVDPQNPAILRFKAFTIQTLQAPDN